MLTRNTPRWADQAKHGLNATMDGCNQNAIFGILKGGRRNDKIRSSREAKGTTPEQPEDPCSMHTGARLLMRDTEYSTRTSGRASCLACTRTGAHGTVCARA
eukprot:6827144-Alexandrium_andersonii.AAC.1